MINTNMPVYDLCILLSLILNAFVITIIAKKHKMKTRIRFIVFLLNGFQEKINNKLNPNPITVVRANISPVNKISKYDNIHIVFDFTLSAI